MATAEVSGGTEYVFGAQIRLRMYVRQDDVLLDPSGEVTIIVEDPDGVETTEIYNGGAGNVARESVGVFYLDVTGTKAGIWEYRLKTESPIGVQESYFVVLASRVATP